MEAIPHLELILGTMFSGKSTELIRRVKRYEIAGLACQTFKPAIDDRYGQDHIASHDELRKKAEYVSSVDDLKAKLKAGTEVIGIDEVQFLDSSIIEYGDAWANQGKIIVAAGLLKDFRDYPFAFQDQKKTMLDLVGRADHITYLKAICQQEVNQKPCGREATRVQRFLDGKVAPAGSDVVMVGGKEAYEPRCRQHFKFYGR